MEAVIPFTLVPAMLDTVSLNRELSALYLQLVYFAKNRQPKHVQRDLVPAVFGDGIVPRVRSQSSSPQDARPGARPEKCVVS